MTDLLLAHKKSAVDTYVAKTVHKLDSLVVEDTTDISVSSKAERQISFLHTKDTLPLLSGVVLVATATPTVFYSIAPELYYTVPAIAGMVVFSLSCITVLGRRLNRKIDRTHKALLQKYIPEVESWLANQSIHMTATQTKRITNIITGHEYNSSGHCFVDESGDMFMLVYDNSTVSWYMNEVSPVNAGGELPARIIMETSFPQPEIFDVVIRRINLVKKHAATVEEHHIIDSLQSDAHEAVALTEKLYALKDVHYMEGLVASLELINVKVEEIMSSQRREVRFKMKPLTADRKDIE